MNELSFFYDPSKVFKLSLKALQRRKFEILESNESSGIIRATISKGILKAGVDIELIIKQQTENHTTVNIKTALNKSWITTEGYHKTIERKFIDTLYNCFNSMKE